MCPVARASTYGVFVPLTWRLLKSLKLLSFIRAGIGGTVRIAHGPPFKPVQLRTCAAPLPPSNDS